MPQNVLSKQLDDMPMQVGGRLLKYSYQAGRVSQWIASKLQSSVAKNMVFPSCSDIPLPFLLGNHPDMASVPSSFLSQGNSRKGRSMQSHHIHDQCFLTARSFCVCWNQE